MALPKKSPRSSPAPADARSEHELPSASLAAESDLPLLIELDPAEAWAEFDRQARRLLAMTGEEFSRRYDQGEFGAVLDHIDHLDISHLAMIRPSGR